MTEPTPNLKRLVSIRDVHQANSCRRKKGRKPLLPSSVVIWSDVLRPVQINVVEVDSFGARVVLPRGTQKGQKIRISISNSIGEHTTVQARVVWAQPMFSSARSVAGLSFEQEIDIAA